MGLLNNSENNKHISSVLYNMHTQGCIQKMDMGGGGGGGGQLVMLYYTIIYY